MKVRELLGASGLEPREARLLLAAACALPEASLIAHPERELAAQAGADFLALAQRRRAGEPIAYLLGRREFYGLDLEVGPQVLIPRPESELLVDLALERIELRSASQVADLGTGSGALALAIKRHRPRAHVVAVDASAQALALAARNAARLGIDIELREGSWCSPLGRERFDVIVTNPPYVAAGDSHLDLGDLRFEPRAALVGGADGLDAVREILGRAPAHLRPGGTLLIEHGIGQDGAVRALMQRAGLAEPHTRPDLAGIPRVSCARMH